MKKLLAAAIAVGLLLTLATACKKKKTDSCSSEPAIAATSTPANGTVEPPAPGPDFPLHISITSTIPTSGVTIDVKAHPESSSTTFFTETRSSTSTSNDFTITGTPATITCLVEITITSKSCSTNKWTGSYRYSRK